MTTKRARPSHSRKIYKLRTASNPLTTKEAFSALHNDLHPCHSSLPSFVPLGHILIGVVVDDLFLDIRDAHDAHVVLEAVRLNVLPLIKRRLLSNEREDLKSGHVYVWEEAQDDGGLLRWTDGRRW